MPVYRKDVFNILPGPGEPLADPHEAQANARASLLAEILGRAVSASQASRALSQQERQSRGGGGINFIPEVLHANQNTEWDRIRFALAEQAAEERQRPGFAASYRIPGPNSPLSSPTLQVAPALQAQGGGMPQGVGSIEEQEAWRSRREGSEIERQKLQLLELLQAAQIRQRDEELALEREKLFGAQPEGVPGLASFFGDSEVLKRVGGGRPNDEDIAALDLLSRADPKTGTAAKAFASSRAQSALDRLGPEPSDFLGGLRENKLRNLLRFLTLVLHANPLTAGYAPALGLLSAKVPSQEREREDLRKALREIESVGR